MPEIRFRVRWPDGQVEHCYSPSTIVREYLTVGTDYSLDDFVARARTALSAANDRVRARFGMGCAQAINQLAAIERQAGCFADIPNPVVRIETFEA